MYSIRYEFYPKTDNYEEFFDHQLSSFLASIYKNGQIVGEWNIAERSDHLELHAMVPDEDSLSVEYHTKYAIRALEQVIEASTKAPRYQVLGQCTGEGNPCRCESPSTYVLFTTHLHIEPPVVCLDCWRYVPLYKIPHPYSEDDYCSIVSWADTYKACDRLYMGSSFGERYGLRQISKPDSQLSSEGINICRDLTDRTGKPFYYYIWSDFSKPEKVVSAGCPSCHGEWEVTYRAGYASRIDLLCRKCGLVSIV